MGRGSGFNPSRELAVPTEAPQQFQAVGDTARIIAHAAKDPRTGVKIILDEVQPNGQRLVLYSLIEEQQELF